MPGEKRATSKGLSADTYIRFLELAELIKSMPTLPALDPLEERILNLVARSSIAQERLGVRDMLKRDELGSSTTIHGRLKSMREKGWIQLADTEDARRKQIELTDAALRHMAHLARCMEKAVQA